MAGEIYIDIDLDFTMVAAPPVIELTQYSKILPVIRASLYSGGVAYNVPSEATVKVRYGKPTGTVIYESATYSDNVVSYAMSEQCGTAAGDCTMCFEVTLGSGILQTPVFIIRCNKNPMQNDAVKDASRIAGIEDSAEAAASSAKAAATSESNASKSATSAASSASSAASSAAAAQTSVDSLNIGLTVVNGELCVTYTE